MQQCVYFNSRAGLRVLSTCCVHTCWKFRSPDLYLGENHLVRNVGSGFSLRDSARYSAGETTILQMWRINLQIIFSYAFSVVYYVFTFYVQFNSISETHISKQVCQFNLANVFSCSLCIHNSTKTFLRNCSLAVLFQGYLMDALCLETCRNWFKTHVDEE